MALEPVEGFAENAGVAPEDDWWGDNDCFDGNGAYYPEHDFPEGHPTCSRCDAEVDE